MKLNFWQWLGLILLVIGVALWIYKKTTATPERATEAPVLRAFHPAAAVPPVV